jgi:hypothetical protein
MSTVRLVTVFAENKLGEIARVTRYLAEAELNIRWVTIATTDKFGVMKFLVDRWEPAQQALQGKGLTVSTLEVVAVEIKDEPGALQTVAELLSKHAVNVENVSGFVANKRAVLVLEVQDVAKAQTVLQKHGQRLLTQKELLSL